MADDSITQSFTINMKWLEPYDWEYIRPVDSKIPFYFILFGLDILFSPGLGNFLKGRDTTTY